MIRLLTQRDIDEVMKYLKRNHIEVTFQIGNIKEFGLENDRDKKRCGDYYGYFEDGRLKGILPFYNLGSCIPHYESPNAIMEFANIMNISRFQFLLGMEKIIKPIYDKLENKKIHSYESCSYFVNKNFTPFTLEDVEIENARDIPLNKAVEYALEAGLKGFGREIPYDVEAKSIMQESVEEDYVFLIKDDKIVAQANIQTTTDEINQIGGVYTSEEERGKGYCKAVVSEICKRITARGKIPTLMVVKKNTPAVKAYSALGFKHYDDYLLIEFEK